MYNANERVREICRLEKIGQEEFDILLEKAAITTKDGFNRRYHFWDFFLNEDTVVVEDMRYADMLGHGNQEKLCPVCEGQGCHTCGWWGKIKAPGK